MTAEGSRHSARCTVSAQRRRVAFSCPVVSSTCGPLTPTARAQATLVSHHQVSRLLLPWVPSTRGHMLRWTKPRPWGELCSCPGSSARLPSGFRQVPIFSRTQVSLNNTSNVNSRSDDNTHSRSGLNWWPLPKDESMS